MVGRPVMRLVLTGADVFGDRGLVTQQRRVVELSAERHFVWLDWLRPTIPLVKSDSAMINSDAAEPRCLDTPN